MAWQDIARAVAPTLATGLLGPLGGVVASVAANALFPGDPAARQSATPDSIKARIAAMTSPEDVAKLRQAEADVRKFEADNEFRFAELDARSREGARAMRTAALASGNDTADRLSWLVVISFLAVAVLVLLGCALYVSGWLVTAGTTPQDMAERAQRAVAISGLIGAIVGYFSANAQQVVSFYFGSSAGSAAKTDQLAAATRDVLSTVRSTAPARTPAPVVPAPIVTGTRTEVPGGPTTTTMVGGQATEALAEGAEPRGGAGAASAAPARVPDNARWDACVTYVLEREGGFVEDPADPGGATNMGITHRTLAAWRNAPVTADDVRALSVEEAKAIYRANYWNVARCDGLPPGVDLSVMDAGVLSGPAQGVRFLQRAVGLEGDAVDGVVGPQTLAATARMTPGEVIEHVARQRISFYEAIAERRPESGKFLRGWKNRVDMTRSRARAMSRLWS